MYCFFFYSVNASRAISMYQTACHASFTESYKKYMQIKIKLFLDVIVVTIVIALIYGIFIIYLQM